MKTHKCTAWRLPTAQAEEVKVVGQFAKASCGREGPHAYKQCVELLAQSGNPDESIVLVITPITPKGSKK